MKKIILTLLMIVPTILSYANNIVVYNSSLSGQNTSLDYTMINFDVAWQNSWRTNTNEGNCDGAWIFVKYRKNGTSDWRHCTISSTGNTPSSGAMFAVPVDNKGAFIYRSSNGIGDVYFASNALRWDYGADGVLDNETVEIRVFALEMVLVRIGSYQLGSGGSEANAFSDGNTSNPYLVASNSAITFGNSNSGELNTNGLGPTSGTLPEAFPKGYYPFWIMKYEISQQQYADFLNHIDFASASQNNISSAGITGTHPNLTAPYPERAMNLLSPTCIGSIADWSALRPMTELEFEKACRGYNTPAVPNEFVWGNTLHTALSSVSYLGTDSEKVASPLTANVSVASTYGTPTRVGLFARSTGSTRALSGAGYYGMMNMADNVHEICVVINTPEGRSFIENEHGDGYLNASGKSDIANWANYLSYGARGGSYQSSVNNMRISDRTSVGLYNAVYNYDATVAPAGGRMVRQAQ